MGWTAPAGPNIATSYRLQASLDPSFAALVIDVNVGNVTTFDASGAPGTFFVRVLAVNDCGVSAASNTATVTLP
jgi:pyrimidine deaminase RibD-like protein